MRDNQADNNPNSLGSTHLRQEMSEEWTLLSFPSGTKKIEKKKA